MQTSHTQHSDKHANIKKSDIVDNNNAGHGSKIYSINAGDVFMMEPQMPCVFG
jgi:hypothetical protein